MLIKNLLKQRKMSQNMLAYKVQIPQSSLSLIINGKLYPCPAWRKRIAAALGVEESLIFPVEVNKYA